MTAQEVKLLHIPGEKRLLVVSDNIDVGDWVIDKNNPQYKMKVVAIYNPLPVQLIKVDWEHSDGSWIHRNGIVKVIGELEANIVHRLFENPDLDRTK